MQNRLVKAIADMPQNLTEEEAMKMAESILFGEGEGKMGQHTAGQLEAIGNLVRTSLNEGGFLVGEFRDAYGLPHNEEAYANARLFAAAPDLLEALERLLASDANIVSASDEELIAATNDENALPIVREQAAAVLNARAAIAKAKGL